MESSDAFAFYEKLMKQELQMDKALVSQLFETIHYLYPKTAEQQTATKAVASKRDEVNIPGLAMQNTAPVQIEVNDKDAKEWVLQCAFSSYRRERDGSSHRHRRSPSHHHSSHSRSHRHSRRHSRSRSRSHSRSRSRSYNRSRSRSHSRSHRHSHTVELAVNQIYDGRVKSIMDYGAFIELLGVYPPREGLCHISNIAPQRIHHPNDVLQRDQRVKVKVTQISGNRISLSLKDVDQRTGEDLGNVPRRYDSSTGVTGPSEPTRAPPKRKRLSSYERFEMEQLIASGVMTAAEQAQMMAQYDLGGPEEVAPEEEVNVEVSQNLAPFLKDQKLEKVDMTPTKIVKNPEGTMARNALAGQAMMQERKRLRERQRQEEREKLPEVGVVGSCDV